MPTLVVVRHAKAGPHVSPDHDRPLVEKGQRQSASIGRFLREAGIEPEIALVSSAARTVQTWELLAASAGYELEPSISSVLYAAGPQTMLEAVRDLPDGTGTAIIVGHNPTVHDVAFSLAGPDSDAAAYDALQRGYPTGATTVFDVPGPWSALDPRAARLTAFHAP